MTILFNSLFNFYILFFFFFMTCTYLNILKRSIWNSDTDKNEIGRIDRNWSVLAMSPAVIWTIPILSDLTGMSHCKNINI